MELTNKDNNAIINTNTSLYNVNFYFKSEICKWLFNKYGSKDQGSINLKLGDDDNYSFDVIDQPIHCVIKVINGEVVFLLHIRNGYGIYQDDLANIHIVFHTNGEKPSLIRQNGIGGDISSIISYYLKVAMQLRKQVSYSFYKSIADLNLEKEGVLIKLSDDDIVFERVAGRRRPSMLCNSLFEGMHMARPYLDEQASSLAGEMFQENLPFESLIELAEDGDEDAMGKVALTFLNGDDEAGIKPDAEKAAFWFRKQADEDDPTGCFNLAILYLKGEGVTQDFGQALFWMKKAEENADSDAAGYIPILEKLSALKAKADQKDTGAMAELANQLMAVGKNVGGTAEEQFYAKSVELAEKADAANEPEACWVLALAYEHGRGVQENTEKALAYYQKGTDLGNLDCQANLGVHYIEGKIVPEDKVKGFKLCLKAAEKGNGTAMRAVGACYQFGHGVQDDMKKAIHWYEKALEVINDPELAKKVMIFKSLEDVDAGTDEEKWTPPKGYEEALDAFEARMSVGEDADASKRKANEKADVLREEERKKKEQREKEQREKAQREKEKREKEQKEKEQQEKVKKLKIKQEEELNKRIKRKEQIIKTFADVVCNQIAEDNKELLKEQETAKRDAEAKHASLGFFKRKQKQEQQAIIEKAQSIINKTKEIIENADIASEIGKRNAAALAEEDRELLKSQVAKLLPIPEQNVPVKKAELKTKLQIENEEAAKEILITLQRKNAPMTLREIAEATPAVYSFTFQRITHILNGMINDGTVRGGKTREGDRCYSVWDKAAEDTSSPLYEVLDVDPNDTEAVKRAIKNDLDFILRQWKYDSRRRIGAFTSDIYEKDIVDTRQMRIDILRFYKSYVGQNLQTVSALAAESLKESNGSIKLLANDCVRDLELHNYLSKPYRQGSVLTYSLTDKGKMLLAVYQLFYG